MSNDIWLKCHFKYLGVETWANYDELHLLGYITECGYFNFISTLKCNYCITFVNKYMFGMSICESEYYYAVIFLVLLEK